MKRTWIYVAIIALLVAAAYLMRERFDDYAQALNSVGQTAGYTNLNAPAGTANTGVGTAFAGASPTEQTAGMAAATTGGARAGTTGSTASGASTGNTTGGTTTNPQPTSGGLGGSSAPVYSEDSQKVAGVPGNNVFGPAFMGVGANGNAAGQVGPVPYPYLYGPKPDSSTMVPGAGIAQPSQAATLTDSGALPSSKGTGSDKNSQYFGASRVPGDKDIVPNPYATNIAFSPSSGSSKTEPLPYLTDFSAFGK
jgi:hypothetical protein